MTIEAVLFDKDGTLFDFRASWTDWMHATVLALAAGDAGRLAAVSGVLGFDPVARVFAPDSVVIAGTLRQSAEALAAVLPGRSVDDLAAALEASAADVRMAPAVPLAPLLERLRAGGARLGVATNATAGEAAAHLDAAGIGEAFDLVLGCDSGHGAKPDPGMCRAFAAALGVRSERIVMVGDSLHDLHAGRAAGMAVAAVLTGLARADDLAPHADVVLEHVGCLPDWLETQRAR